MTCEGVIATEKSVEKQVIPVGKYSGEEEEMTLCEAVVKGGGTLPILITNTGNKTKKVLRGEELGHAPSLRNKIEWNRHRGK